MMQIGQNFIPETNGILIKSMYNFITSLVPNSLGDYKTRN